MWRFWSKCADMINGELSGLIMSIRDIRLNDSLSDDALIALSRSYVSMQNLVVANGLDSEYGSRKEFEKALDILFRICHRRCQSNQPFARRSRLLPLLHGLVTLPMRVAELRRVQECNGLMWQLVDEWMQNPEMHAERMSVSVVLRCIAAMWGGVADEERTAGNAEVLWFRQRIGDWASLLSGECRWDGVASDEALCRIEVMSRNSNLFLDGSNDELIELPRLMGASHFRIIFVHILPNILPILLSSVIIGFNNAVLAEAGLSYLGIGIQPPDASLGRMLSEAQSFLFTIPWYSIFPGLMIILMVLGFSMIAEGIDK